MTVEWEGTSKLFDRYPEIETDIDHIQRNYEVKDFTKRGHYFSRNLKKHIGLVMNKKWRGWGRFYLGSRGP